MQHVHALPNDAHFDGAGGGDDSGLLVARRTFGKANQNSGIAETRLGAVAASGPRNDLWEQSYCQ
jgi:hypothetical protein